MYFKEKEQEKPEKQLGKRWAHVTTSLDIEAAYKNFR